MKVYKTPELWGYCQLCGRYQDLRFGVCFDCANTVKINKNGICYDEKTGKTWDSLLIKLEN